MSISKNRFAISVSGYDNQHPRRRASGYDCSHKVVAVGLSYPLLRRRASGYETLRTNHFITGQADKFAVLRGSQISKIQMFFMVRNNERI